MIISTRLPVVVGLLFASSAAVAGTVSGTVEDDSGRPVAYATVYQPQTLVHDHTDELGRFRVDDVSAGDTLYVEAIGFGRRGLVLAEAATDGAPG